MKTDRPPKNTISNKVTLKERFEALRNLPAFFKLVWQTSRWMTIVNALLRIIRSAMPLGLLYIGKLIIDQVVMVSHEHVKDMTYLWQLVGLEFTLAILTDALSRAITLMDSLLGDLFSNYTSVRIMEHAATLDLDQFEDSVFYDKLERARQQTVGRTILLSQVMSQVQDLITMGFLAVGLMAFNPWLIVLLLIAIIPAFLGESYFNDQSYALTRGQTPERRELDYIRYLGASDETAKEVKIFDLSGFIIDRFRLLSDKFYGDNKQLAIKRSLWGTFFAMLGSLGYYAAYLVIIVRTVNGSVTIGELAFLAGSFRQLRALLEGILTRFTAVSQGAIYLRDFFEFFEIVPKIKLAEHALPFPKTIQQGFTFENVGFRYINSDRWANRHLNFTLYPGEKLALVGENGAGKTTLVKLLARLYDPTEGRILLDGIDLKQYDLTDLRLNVGVIFQDYLRYQMTFAQNIAVGKISEKDNRPLIENSARQSLADILAAKLPGTYDQQLGKRFADGVELSGGEWQKVALARAYMRDAQLLILDEPTSALDARAEYNVFERFAELTKGKSAVLISHRFSTVRMADRILVLEKGELIEIGSHEELLLKGGRYAELFDLQAAGYR
ncbi:ATP-binding cassette, subfamily B [Mucilaginibacter lappiensis]|uniref:ATP-binding cassette subfamily B protein n=1 Tax=Mucilaginibacter lappiensis TaxID=354630 RepID=A0ABR6PKQ7_9SPHI|nr:ABC transporter ATP-binding protein [Mucilaginibacter lappiensis]MBB6108826.1 ATP-binding cassette subfamily B protein [Mucilaginibacter lappiensis]SIQ63801.1 ATP-binding cassette, subfamily B [Mucilaginibacter lappiensis]